MRRVPGASRGEILSSTTLDGGLNDLRARFPAVEPQGSPRPDSWLLDLERDLPATEQDILVLRQLRATATELPLVHVNRLVAPMWTREAAAARPTFEGCEPFEL